MNMDEINIVITEDDGMQVVCAFTDRETAVGWFTRLKKMGRPVSIECVEVNTAKPFIQLS